MDRFPIKDDTEFDSVMEEIDRQCQQRGEQIIGRELRLWMEFCKKYQLVVASKVSTAHPAQPNVYTIFNFENHIMNWARNRYGTRLGLDPSWGYFATMIKGDAWLVRVPMIMGNVSLTVVTDIELAQPPNILNLLTMIKGLTPHAAHLLTEEEVQSIKQMFLVHFDIHNLLVRANIASDSLAAIAALDLTSGAKRVVSDRRELGAARFDALQAAEKFLKHFIQAKGHGFERNHVLSELSKTATSSGLTGAYDSLIADAQTSGGSRYGEKSHTVPEVVKALDAAAVIGRNVMAQLYASSANVPLVSTAFP